MMGVFSIINLPISGQVRVTYRKGKYILGAVTKSYALSFCHMRPYWLLVLLKMEKFCLLYVRDSRVGIFEGKVPEAARGLWNDC